MQTSACWERSATSVGIQGGRPSAVSSIHINSDLQHNPENGCIIPIFQRESLVPDTCTMSEDGYHLWPSNSKLRLFKIHFCVILNSSAMARNEASMQNNSLDSFLNCVLFNCNINVDEGGDSIHNYNLNTILIGFYCCLGMGQGFTWNV